MFEAQDAGDRFGGQADLGMEALDQRLAAAGEGAAQRADRAGAAIGLELPERPGDIG